MYETITEFAYKSLMLFTSVVWIIFMVFIIGFILFWLTLNVMFYYDLLIRKIKKRKQDKQRVNESEQVKQYIRDIYRGKNEQ